MEKALRNMLGFVILVFIIWLVWTFKTWIIVSSLVVALVLSVKKQVKEKLARRKK